MCAAAKARWKLRRHGALPRRLELRRRLCTSHPSLLLPPAPPPSAARGRARIYCKSELLGRSHTPTEGSSLEAAVVSVA